MALRNGVMMLKKLLLSIIFGLSFAASHTMQSPISSITYEGPQPTIGNDAIEINARKDDLAVGWIVYNFDKPKQAEITLFEVDEEMRNKKELRIGQTLFQKLINDALDHQCIKATWTVNPVSNLDTKTLCTIYEKIVKKLQNSESYELIKGDEYGPLFNKIDMTLLLKR